MTRQEVYSYSRLSTFRECPRKYQFKYVDRVREAFRTVEAHLGHAVHAALAWLYDGRDSLASPSPADLLEKFDAEWRGGLGPDVKLIRKDDSLEERRATGRRMLSLHYEGPYRRDRLRTVATEQDLETLLDGSRRYLGIVDRIARDASGGMHLIDYKTTARPPAALNLESALQLRSYGLLCMRHHGATTVRLTFHFLANQSDLGETLRDAEAPTIAGELVSRISRVEAATRFPADPSGLCAWCGYREMCESSGFFAGPGGPPASECPRCGGELRRRHGKYGAFLGCENFPRCRYTRDP
jgi:RecB family exonuclease